MVIAEQAEEMAKLNARGIDTQPVFSTEQVRTAYDCIHARVGMKAVPGYYNWALSLLGTYLRGLMLDVDLGTGAMLAAAAASGIAAVTTVHRDSSSFVPTPVLQAASRMLGRLTPLALCCQSILVARPVYAHQPASPAPVE